MEILIKVKMKCQMQQLYHLFFVTESVGGTVCACLSPLNGIKIKDKVLKGTYSMAPNFTYFSRRAYFIVNGIT